MRLEKTIKSQNKQARQVQVQQKKELLQVEKKNKSLEKEIRCLTILKEKNWKQSEMKIRSRQQPKGHSKSFLKKGASGTKSNLNLNQSSNRGYLQRSTENLSSDRNSSIDRANLGLSKSRPSIGILSKSSKKSRSRQRNISELQQMKSLSISQRNSEIKIRATDTPQPMFKSHNGQNYPEF